MKGKGLKVIIIMSQRVMHMIELYKYGIRNMFE